MIRWNTEFRDGPGVRYEFENAGERLREHQHRDPITEHNVACLEVLNGEEHLVQAGEVFDFDSSQPHDVVAKIPNTITFHRYINGPPPDYLNPAPEYQSGVMN
jgi:hypothetical protein